jgi:hypothetical protein
MCFFWVCCDSLWKAQESHVVHQAWNTYSGGFESVLRGGLLSLLFHSLWEAVTLLTLWLITPDEDGYKAGGIFHSMIFGIYLIKFHSGKKLR